MSWTPEKDKEAKRAYQASPRGKWSQQKASAKRRSIPYELSFEEYWGLWEPHWDNKGKDGACMSRYGDTGPYALGNVFISTMKQNGRESCLRNPQARNAAGRFI